MRLIISPRDHITGKLMEEGLWKPPPNNSKNGVDHVYGVYSAFLP
jgi:hypothetical protein